MVYGTAQDEGKQNGENTCGASALESGAHEMSAKEHVYELTSGCTYDVPKKLTYSTRGPSEEMVIRLNYHVHLHVVARTQTLVNAWNVIIVVNFGLIMALFGFVNPLCLPTLTTDVIFSSLPTLSITTHQFMRAQQCRMLSFSRG